MRAEILPDAEDFALNPAAEEVLEEERRAITDRLPDFNESTIARIETKSELDALNEKEAARERARGERETPREAAEPVAPPATDFRADVEALRHQSALLENLAQVAQPQTREAAAEDDGVSDDLEFFRSPGETVAKAVARHPVIAGLKAAITETFQRKTSDQFKQEFPDLEQTIADPEFRKWATASPIRMELLKAANENYDLEAGREVFGTWKALRGGDVSSARAGKTKVYRRSDVQRLMRDDPAKYEQLEPEITLAYAQGRVRDL